jgi:hypothetical protein
VVDVKSANVDIYTRWDERYSRYALGLARLRLSSLEGCSHASTIVESTSLDHLLVDDNISYRLPPGLGYFPSIL